MRDFLKLVTKHTVIFSIGDIAQKAMGFLLLPVYMRCLSPDDYGVIAMLSIATTVFGGVILQGLPTASFRAYSFDYSNDEKGQEDVIYTAYAYLLIISFIFYLILFLSSSFWSHIFFKEGDFTRFIRIVFITGFFSCASNIPFVILRARLLSAWLAGISLGRVFIGASMIIWFVVFKDMGVEGVLMANLIMSILVFFASPLIPIIIHKRFSLHISLKKLKVMLLFGLPMVPGLFASWIMSSADRYFIEHFSTRAELGLYSIGFSFASILTFAFIAPFRKTWPAVFYPKAQEGDAKEVFSRFATYFLLVGSIITLGIICASEHLIILMGPKEYWDAYIVVPILVIGVFLHGFQATINLGLFIESKTKYAPLIVAGGAASNILFNALLVPHFGMMGAATGTLLAYLVLLALTLAINQHIYPVQYEYGRIIHLSIIIFMIVAVNYVIRLDSFWWMISIRVVLFSSFILLLFLTKFFTQSELAVIKECHHKYKLLAVSIGAKIQKIPQTYIKKMISR